MHVGLQRFFFFFSFLSLRARGENFDIFYFELFFIEINVDDRDYYYSLLFFSLLSKYCINIIIAIIVLLLRQRDYHRRIMSKVQQTAS